uniref:Prominin-1-A-like isoform X2 n=1 Tax=Petromyzon marinus TaxID=7757 RepID=A0AAJ7SZ84_PETMA|nr:prominin-1-A-like isoform X2 [Petromyzon marinus]
MRQLRHATVAWLCLAALCALAPAMSAQAISGNSSSYPAYPSITSSPLTVDASYQPGSIEPLFNMTNYFLNVVQPRAWPSDLIGTDFSKISQNLQALVKEYNGSVESSFLISMSEHPDHTIWTLKVALYEVGFIVCALIGIIFIVFMPIVGFFFCVCRCCLNCGGEMHQREKDITPCRRHTFGTFLAIVTIIMLAGIACAFATNEQTTTSMKKLPKLMTDNLRDLATFISDIPKQGNQILNQYGTFSSRVMGQLSSIDSSVGGSLQTNIGDQARPLQSRALALYAKMQNISATLQNVDSSQRNLLGGVAKLSADLEAQRQNLTGILGACGPNCSVASAKLTNLSIAGNFSNMANLSEQIASVDSALKTNITALVLEGNKTIADIPSRVKNETVTSVADAQKQLDNINVTVSNIRRDIFDKFLQSDFSVQINTINTSITPVLNQFPDYEHYRWIAGVVLCCMILAICLMNILGLLFGTCGYDRNRSPTDRGCASNCGGSFLMASVGLSFIFSWILMILVTILFFSFGNVHKLLCEPLASKDFLKFADSMAFPGIPTGNGSVILRLLNMSGNVSTLDIYNGCTKNGGTYSVLHLETQYNLDNYLNITKYEADLNKALEKMNVSFSDIKLLSATGQQSLTNFSDNGLNNINFSTFFTEIDKGVVKLNLSQFAMELRNISNNSNITDSANNLERMDREQVVPLQGKLDELKRSVEYLKDEANKTKVEVGNIIDDFRKFEKSLNENGSLLINATVENLLGTVRSLLRDYISWSRDMVMNKLAPCKPLANLIDSIELIGCKYLVNSMNSFWFGLGWATIFLIPSVIFAVKLAKFYRRMDTEDDYSD